MTKEAINHSFDCTEFASDAPTLGGVCAHESHPLGALPVQNSRYSRDINLMTTRQILYRVIVCVGPRRRTHVWLIPSAHRWRTPTPVAARV